MTKKYKALIDVDTLIIHAALAGQKTHIKVVGKNTGRTLIFKNRSEFYGSWQKKDGGWLKEFNKKREAKGLSPIPLDVFDIHDVIEPIEDQVSDNGTIITPEIVVKGRFKSKIEAITSQPWCEDFVICFGTGTNFRYDIAQTQPYKANRPNKPLFYDVVKEYMLTKYKDKIIIVDGVETDEIVTQELWKAWIKAKRNHENLDSVACFIDKDLTQFPCLWYNFDKPELGLVEISSLDAVKNLAVQCLRGDVIDSIPGLPELPNEMFEKYGVKKPSKKGLGEKTAHSLIDPCQTPKEVFERVVEAYRGYYGDARMQFVSFRGEFSDRNWLDHLNEQFRLLRMRTDVTKDVGHVSKFLKAMGIKV